MRTNKKHSMGETDETIDANEGAASDDGDTSGSDDTTEDESDTSQNNDDNDASDDGAEDGDDKGKGDSQETDTADDDAEADDGSEPELRKPKVGASNSEWAAWRAQEKAKREKAGESGKDETDDAEDGDDDDDLSEADRIALDKRIEKQLAPFKKQAAEQEVETEIANFLAKNPDFKPFEAKVKRWALHPNRSGVPVKSIFFEVAGDKLLALGAKRAKAADVKANRTKVGGGSNVTKDQGGKSYKDMSLNDFGKELEAAKLGR